MSAVPHAPIPDRGAAPTGSQAAQLDALLSVYRKWLHLPDAGLILAAAATVQSNRQNGDPVWLGGIGAPGTGKTETLDSFTSLPEIHPAATLTEASLLSGTPKRERSNEATGGLLRRIGSYGIICCKDFTSVLSMNKDGRAQVLAALREVYDGAWTRYVGTDGGRTLTWTGKVGMLAGCTPTIDRHHAVMGAMGERFVFYRLPPADEVELARQSMRHVGHEAEMRSELRAAVATFFDQLPTDQPPPLTTPDRDRLIDLASLAVRARSSVERDPYTREIVLIPDPEAPTRLANVLARQLASLRQLGVDNREAWRITQKLGLDSMPAIRRSVLRHLEAATEPATTTDVATTCGYPTRTAERALEDLTAHKLCTRKHAGQGHANTWQLTSWTRERITAITSPESPPPATSPESPTLLNTRPHPEEGKSGDPPRRHPYWHAAPLSRTAATPPESRRRISGRSATWQPQVVRQAIGRARRKPAWLSRLRRPCSRLLTRQRPSWQRGPDSCSDERSDGRGVRLLRLWPTNAAATTGGGVYDTERPAASGGGGDGRPSGLHSLQPSGARGD
jgi:hypothetical protein